MFSRYIVGYEVSSSLAVEGALRALEMAIGQAQGAMGDLIHHSDHGVQYTAAAYRERLGREGIAPARALWATPATMPLQSE